MNLQADNERWQVEANGEVYDTTFGEMTEWIEQGSLLRVDRVKRGNLRWIEAGKVPSLMAVFNAKENGQPIAPVVTLTQLEPSSLGVGMPAAPVNAVATESPTDLSVCAIHKDAPASFVCGTCGNPFCKACPNRYGSVRICPMCGAICNLVGQVETVKADVARRQSGGGGSLNLGDLGRALAHPFRFQTSLILGALIFAVLSLGQSAMGFGGIFMLAGALFSFMLANTLTFGILANTAENFSVGRLETNFMPSFEDFNAWDDVIQPFFLSVGVYLSSFGPFIVLMIVMFFFIAGSLGSQMNGMQTDAAKTVTPELPYAANAVRQSQEVRSLLDKEKTDQQQRVESLEKGLDTANTAPPVRPTEPSEQDFERINNMIQQQQKAQLESTLGKAPDTVAQEREQMLRQALGAGPIFVILGAIFMLWGMFYFPAACAVAGYTRSIGATLNPSVGIDTIRRLGFDYVKLLGMAFVLTVISGAISLALAAALSAFDMPAVGNVPAKFLGSLVGFYIWAVFSCIIGYTLYKASDRLKLPV